MYIWLWWSIYSGLLVVNMTSVCILILLWYFLMGYKYRKIKNERSNRSMAEQTRINKRTVDRKWLGFLRVQCKWLVVLLVSWLDLRQRWYYKFVGWFLLCCRRTRGDGILSNFNMRLILMEGNGGTKRKAFRRSSKLRWKSNKYG